VPLSDRGPISGNTPLTACVHFGRVGQVTEPPAEEGAPPEQPASEDPVPQEAAAGGKS
jgi:hypothetical protein